MTEITEHIHSQDGTTHIHFVFNDEGDWAGIYYQGTLKYEGHSIPDHKYIEIIAKLAECYEKPYHRRITSQHNVNISDQGRFPQYLHDLPGWVKAPWGLDWEHKYLRADDDRANA